MSIVNKLVRFLRSIRSAMWISVVAVVTAACDNPPRSADLTWIEPVHLAPGETIEIKRRVMMWHERAFGGGFSSAPVYKTSSIELSPSSADFPIWDAPLVPVVLDKDPANGEWIIVASIDGCSLWLRNGLPRPPYWAFRLRRGEWYRDAIPESFLGRPANLFVEVDVTDSSSGLEEQIEGRKRSQFTTPKHAPQYGKIDTEFKKRCGGQGEPSKPIGREELDLAHFRSLP